MRASGSACISAAWGDPSLRRYGHGGILPGMNRVSRLGSTLAALLLPLLTHCSRAPAQVGELRPLVDARAPGPSPTATDASANATASAIVDAASPLPKSPYGGVWHAGLVIPGGSAEDVYLLSSNRQWRWHASSHRGCRAGVVDRFGVWSDTGGTITFVEQLRIVRKVVEAKKHASYLACTGYWDGKTCDRKQPRGVDADCATAAGTVERPEPASASSFVSGPCTLGKTKTFGGLYSAGDREMEQLTTPARRCLSIDGQAHWDFGGEDDLESFAPERSDVTFTAASGRWTYTSTP